MLRITKETDYAIVLLALLAQRPDRVATARQIASSARLPLPMVSKILRALARVNVVVSRRGVAGGYRLLRAAEETSVAEVIRAIEGPISMVQCGAEPGMCDQEPVCPTRPNWARISRAVERTLESIPISSMTAGPRRVLLQLGERGKT